jgi:hypothetical protein
MGSGGGASPGVDSSVRKPAALPPITGIHRSTSATVRPPAESSSTRAVRSTTSGIVDVSTTGRVSGAISSPRCQAAYCSRVMSPIVSRPPLAITTAWARTRAAWRTPASAVMPALDASGMRRLRASSATWASGVCGSEVTSAAAWGSQSGTCSVITMSVGVASARSAPSGPTYSNRPAVMPSLYTDATPAATRSA